MKTNKEIYTHYIESINRLNNSWCILKEIKRKKIKGYVLISAFQFALIEYSKPFTNSNGECTNEKNRNEKYKLEKEGLIPNIYKELHKSILNNRDQIYAHNDLTVKNVKLSNYKLQDENEICYLSNHINGLELYAQINDIIKLIEFILDKMYIEKNNKKEKAVSEMV